MAQKKIIRRSKRAKHGGKIEETIPSFRIGIGYDIHRFAPGRKLVLGGVGIPFAMGLDGHSDADVLLHAMCDAILGAAALGDIGKHFPNSNRKWKGIASTQLLSRVNELIAKKGFEVMNIDATIILEKPEIQKFIPSMIRRIARILGLPPSSVSVKATTNERLGALGEGSGCAAFASALLFKS